ncbi:MAG: hypothetical protein SGILL_004592 [Bacillariaceae sp.]
MSKDRTFVKEISPGVHAILVPRVHKAPSLEEVPPERGTILELHSIDHADFDGLIVEYHSLDKETGKYLVVPVYGDADAPAMKVKPKCCKRPEVKPYKLQRVLEDLAFKYAKSQEEPLGTEGADQKFLLLLEKDPCCLPGYAMLAIHEQDCIKRLSERTLAGAPPLASEIHPHFEKAIPYLYRLIANQHAYPDYVKDSMLQTWRRQLAAYLDATGHVKTAHRELKKYKSDDKELVMPKEYDHFVEATMKGEKEMEKAAQFMQQFRLAEEFDKRIKAVHHYLEALSIGIKLNAPTDGAFEYEGKTMFTMRGVGGPAHGPVEQSLRKIGVTMNRFRDYLHIKVSSTINKNIRYEEPRFYGGRDFDADMALFVATHIIDISEKVMEASKKEDGSTVLSVEQAAKYEMDKVKATQIKEILEKGDDYDFTEFVLEILTEMIEASTGLNLD